jgi:hypothetical protein
MTVDLWIEKLARIVAIRESRIAIKLRRYFYLVNLHFNNWSCTTKAAPLPAWAYQTHWVNKRSGMLDPTAPVPAPMSPLNAPDSPNRPDCQLAR